MNMTHFRWMIDMNDPKLIGDAKKWGVNAMIRERLGLSNSQLWIFPCLDPREDDLSIPGDFMTALGRSKLITRSPTPWKSPREILKS